MENIYLIEIRLGTTKWRVNETILAIAKRFRLEKYIERHPHVTLFGPLSLNEGISAQQILDTIGQVAVGYEPIPFMIDGWERRDGMHGSVIAFSVLPSDALRKLTTAIAEALTPLTVSHNRWDAYPEQKWFHVTIANRLEARTAEEIFSVITNPKETRPHIDRSHKGLYSRMRRWLREVLHLKTRQKIWPVTLDETGLRITVMHGDTIFAEYDLFDKYWIFGGERHSSKSWQKILSHFRRIRGLEITAKKQVSEEDIFLIADLHLGHANIIRYCSRPFLFSDVAEMDQVLINNWNSVISPKTRVFFGGDLRYGYHARETEEYRKKLNGKITFIAGNHDGAELETVPFLPFEFRGLKFHLVHNPADAPSDYDGWVIHGHHHNNDLHHFPFINFVDQRINISAEVIGYVPVGLNEICTLIHSRLLKRNTNPVLTRYLTLD
jgi:calcineurin-like phosphoesterase family protein